METYVVTFTHPMLDGPFEVEVMASSPARAELRTRAAAMQRYRVMEFLSEGEVTVTPLAA